MWQADGLLKHIIHQPEIPRIFREEWKISVELQQVLLKIEDVTTLFWNLDTLCRLQPDTTIVFYIFIPIKYWTSDFLS